MRMKNLPGYVKHIEKSEGDMTTLDLTITGGFIINLVGLSTDRFVNVDILKQTSDRPFSEKMIDFTVPKKDLEKYLYLITEFLYILDKLIKEDRLNGKKYHYNFDTRGEYICRYFWKWEIGKKELGIYYFGQGNSFTRVISISYEEGVKSNIWTVKTGVKTIWKGSKLNYKEIERSIEQYFPIGEDIVLDPSFLGWTEGCKGKIGNFGWEIKSIREGDSILGLFVSLPNLDEWVVSYFYGNQDITTILKEILGAVAVYEWILRILTRFKLGSMFITGFRNHNFQDTVELTLSNNNYSIEYGEIIVYIKRELDNFQVTVESGARARCIGNKTLIIDSLNFKESKEKIIKKFCL